ncbi:response regulator transcription factor [Achromobacter mucicolens]|uniref:Transcriptional regulatory protein QseB n=1 Tax=Achromobacter mucicolens TaxID=1389922 RepID=A0ABM8LHC0_9BURK|nr:response regulator transcription factor [Achromobacter mucicolens]CAB3893023.1 Transcriptional regulatory protein QseB [Achromobacter mucicolens]
MRVLLVEDDAMFADALTLALEELDFAMTLAQDVEAAKVLLLQHAFALVLLDIGLHRGSGLDVLRFVRRRGDDVPVILMTARDALSDRIRGLDIGADDYVIKPFEPAELFARMRALLRRSGVPGDKILAWRHVKLDPGRREAFVDEAPTRLSEHEFRTLEMLLRHADRLVSTEELRVHLYGAGRPGESNTIAVFIHSLRKKLGKDTIENVHGQGYRLARDSG